MKANFDRLVIDQEPRRVLFISEPYVAFTKAGFTPAADVVTNSGKLRLEQTLLIAAQSISQKLYGLMLENGNKLSGIEIWIYKSGAEKTAKYVIEE